VLTALLPGMPMLYSGQEAGLNRRLAFFERDTIAWDELPLQDFYTKLLQLKKRHPALRNGDLASQFQRLEGPDGFYGFIREKNGSAVIVLINATAETLAMPGQKTSVNPQKGLFDVFSGEQLTLAQAKARTVPAHGWRVLRTRD
jgi:glycosidase